MLYIIFEQIFAQMTGRTSKDIVTVKYLHVMLGVVAKGPVLHWELNFSVSTAKRKMFMFKICTAENGPGWACLISTRKEHLFGVMGHHMTSMIGQRDN